MYSDSLVGLLNSGLIPMQVDDSMVENALLAVKARSSLFSRKLYRQIFSSTPPDHLSFSRGNSKFSRPSSFRVDDVNNFVSEVRGWRAFGHLQEGREVRTNAHVRARGRAGMHRNVHVQPR